VVKVSEIFLGEKWHCKSVILHSFLLFFGLPLPAPLAFCCCIPCSDSPVDATRMQAVDAITWFAYACPKFFFIASVKKDVKEALGHMVMFKYMNIFQI
jgi:hypothetical protein